MKLFIPNGTWRTLSGALLGVILTGVGLHLFFLDTAGKLSLLTNGVRDVLALPVMGLVTTVFSRLPEGLWPLVSLVIYLFWPVVLALAFFLGGQRQTRKIILKEVLLAVAVLSLSLAGSLARGF